MINTSPDILASPKALRLGNSSNQRWGEYRETRSTSAASKMNSDILFENPIFYNYMS